MKRIISLLIFSMMIIGINISGVHALEGTRIISIRSAKNHQLVVKCSRVAESKGYQVQAALDENFTSGVKIVSTSKARQTRLVLKNLMSGRIYYIHARSRNGNTYSEWSPTALARVKISHKTSVYGQGLSHGMKQNVSHHIDEFVNKNISQGMSEKEIVLKVYKYVATVHADSNYSMPYKHHENTAWAVFNYAHAACSGFARATKACFDAAGLTSRHVNANKWTHQWVEVLADGIWYHVDTQGQIISINGSNTYQLGTEDITL